MAFRTTQLSKRMNKLAKHGTILVAKMQLACVRMCPYLGIDSSEYRPIQKNPISFTWIGGHFLVTTFRFWPVFGSVWLSPGLISIPNRPP